MKTVVLALLLITLSTTTVYAYDPQSVNPSEPYEVISIEGDPYIEREYLGTLEDYPEMYELKTDVAITLTVRLRQRSWRKAVPFGLILVRQNDDGAVGEIARMNAPLDTWEKVREGALGMTFREAPLLQKELTPGTYHLEVSTPDNKGDYMLVVGEEPTDKNFFATLGHAFTVQRHFGYTPLHLLFSSFLYLPLGILVVLYGIYRTWQYRKQSEYAHINS